LRQGVGGYAFLVLLAESRGELDMISSMGSLLRDIRHIVIVPDRKPKTVAEALKLYPRYLSYADGDFHDVSLVAARMLERLKSERHDN
jgi:hypothetical protein